jgi:ribosome-binding factor A
VPELRFHFDESVVRGQHLSSLIDEAVTTDRARYQGDEDDTEPSEETR